MSEKGFASSLLCMVAIIYGLTLALSGYSQTGGTPPQQGDVFNSNSRPPVDRCRDRFTPLHREDAAAYCACERDYRIAQENYKYSQSLYVNPGCLRMAKQYAEEGGRTAAEKNRLIAEYLKNCEPAARQEAALHQCRLEGLRVSCTPGAKVNCSPPGQPSEPSPAPPAPSPGGNRGGGKTANIPGLGVVSCVPPSDYTETDERLRDLPQTSRSGSGSYNCFYYVRTLVEGARPTDLSILTATGITTNLSPSTAYIDERYLLAHNYRLLWKRAGLRGDREFYQPGDLVMVPGRDNSALGRLIAGNQAYTHTAVVVGVRNGRITRIRQKFDPFTCVVDLTPEEFERVYRPQEVDGRPALYSVWRRPRTFR